MGKQVTEATFNKRKNVLIVLSELENAGIPDDFAGAVLSTDDVLAGADLNQKCVYLCGDLQCTETIRQSLETADRVLVVDEYSTNHESTQWPVVGAGRVPVSVHGVGVFYRQFFSSDATLYGDICAEHDFQLLRESNKPGIAHRTGIYLSPVISNSEGLHFNLLRCSTNLMGPTENFRQTDWHIVNALNEEADFIFENHSKLNHVLAQVYHNRPATESSKQTKAKISSHADKTKDMPPCGVMAFCTFYDQLDRLKKIGDFDYGHKNTSGLTKLIFRLKSVVAERPDCDLPGTFEITLFPNSVFFMPLSTNRLYTHEIRPSMLQASQLPTRLGYVVRCSNTEAVHANGKTYLKMHSDHAELEPPSAEGMKELRKLYAEENWSDGFIDYGDRFRFSMNEGDYLAPRLLDE